MLFSLQYFTGSNGANFDGTVAPTVGGSLFSTDFCPFQDRFSVRVVLCLDWSVMSDVILLPVSVLFSSQLVVHS